MRKLSFVRLAVCAAGFLLSTGVISAGEKALMHCFAFTPIETATEAEWKAFADATDQLPKKIKGVKRVWHGKLRADLTQYRLGMDQDTRKKMMAGEKVTGEITRLPRKHGVCMEMTNEDALKSYAADPYHKTWSEAYEKVRVAGTTTFDIIAQ